VTVWNQILNEKEDPIPGNPLVEEFLKVAQDWIATESQGKAQTRRL